jgi:hypothetical protein
MPSQSNLKHVIGPSGAPLTIADLPSPGAKRWIIRERCSLRQVNMTVSLAFRKRSFFPTLFEAGPELEDVNRFNEIGSHIWLSI